jgi:protein TonB
MEKHRSESLEEMVFSNRNHQYGAYHLRKTYGRHIAAGLFFAIILLFSAVAYPLITDYFGKKTISDHGQTVINVTLKPPPEPPKPFIQTTPLINQTKLRLYPPKVVTGDSTEVNFGNQELLAMNKPEPPTTNEGNIEPVDNHSVQVINVPEKSEPLTWVPEMPEFPGGFGEMDKILVGMLKYPEIAKEADIEGIVYIEFVVEKNGMITDITLKRGIGGGCDEEAIRVVKAMPPWNPGKQNGNPVRVKCTLPIKFTLRH